MHLAAGLLLERLDPQRREVALPGDQVQRALALADLLQYRQAAVGAWGAPPPLAEVPPPPDAGGAALPPLPPQAAASKPAAATTSALRAARENVPIPGIMCAYLSCRPGSP